MGWYVKRGDGEKGPFEFEQLASSLRDGSLKGSALVREGGQGEWRRADLTIARRTPPIGPTSQEREDAERRARWAASRRNLMVGGGLCVAGVLGTVASHTLASGPGGGRAMIFSGAIVWGAMIFVLGLVRR